MPVKDKARRRLPVKTLNGIPDHFTYRQKLEAKWRRNRCCGLTPEQQQAWDADPSPSYAAIAAEIGVDLTPTSPALPGSDVEWRVQAFWPAVDRALL